MKAIAAGAYTRTPDPRRGGLVPTLRGYRRWLRVWAAALTGGCDRLVLTENETQELLLTGFPKLTAVPAALFSLLPAALLPPPFPPGLDTEESALAALRALERRCGMSFDWGAFLTACEKRNRRSLASLARVGRIPPCLDTASPAAALADLLCKR